MLGPQLRDISETQSVFDVLAQEFFPMFNLNFISEAASAIRTLATEFGALSSFGPGHAEAASAKLHSIADGLQTGATVAGEAQAAFAKPTVETIAPIAETVVGLVAPQDAPLAAAAVEIAEDIEHLFAKPTPAPVPAPPAEPATT